VKFVLEVDMSEMPYHQRHAGAWLARILMTLIGRLARGQYREMKPGDGEVVYVPVYGYEPGEVGRWSVA
jgi:hypothetical protein